MSHIIFVHCYFSKYLPQSCMVSRAEEDTHLWLPISIGQPLATQTTALRLALLLRLLVQAPVLYLFAPEGSVIVTVPKE